MLRSIRELQGYGIEANDGHIGHLMTLFFDDENWHIRYLAIDTGNWLPGKKVLLTPQHIGEPDWLSQSLPIDLTKEDIKNSPPIESDMPVSQQLEMIRHHHFDSTPYYWIEPWSGSAYPVWHVGKEKHDDHIFDQHLRSCKNILGYQIQAQDGTVGHVDDFIIDKEKWTIRYLVANTKKIMPGKQVLLLPQCISEIDCENHLLNVDLSSDKIKNSPEYDSSMPVNREYEIRYYDYYGRSHYWTTSNLDEYKKLDNELHQTQ